MFNFVRNLTYKPATNVTVDARMSDFDAAVGADRWSVPFPIGVFGTLRCGVCNHRLMGISATKRYVADEDHYINQVVYNQSPPQYTRVVKAFLPNFFAGHGLWLMHVFGRATFFEVYEYDPQSFNAAIRGIDFLEGFSVKSPYNFGYYRTLVDLRVLPDDYPTPNHVGANVNIPATEWSKYATIRAWVYTSQLENEKSLVSPNTPIVWAGG